MFLGREHEMELLSGLFDNRTSSLVVCTGRRRIGKSRLVEEFGKKAARFLEFQGLPPRKGITQSDQLKEFARQLSQQTPLPAMEITSWTQALSLLASQIGTSRTVVLLDEISWMAGDDRDFAGYLKVAWDTQFKQHQRLVLVLCGSVSSWIDENILNNTGFAGRLSLELTIRQLALFHCNQFWAEKKDRISPAEKLRVLSITGGVPRYLEEIRPEEPTDHAIQRLCFRKECLLSSEFDRIFSDHFSERAIHHRAILSALATGNKSLSAVAKAIERERTGYLSKCLADLQLAGFIQREPVFAIGSKTPGRLHQYRIIDNYVRFYLKYIQPVKENIERDLYADTPLDRIVDWDTILGFQFECLVLNNLTTILRLLGLSAATVLSAAPYFQRTTLRHEACQVDLLIQTPAAVYVCEIKCRAIIDKSIIGEVQEKIRRLNLPRSLTTRAVLIHQGTVQESVVAERFFDRTISFEEMLSSR